MLIKAGRWRITDATIDRDKDIVVPEGGDVNNFLKNPILLYNHSGSGIGRLENLALELDGWYADIMLDPDAKDYNGKLLSDRIKLGTLGMVSIRFISKEREENDHGGLTIKKWELIEVSLVDIPANPNAEKVKSLKSEKYFITNNISKDMKFSDLLSKYFGIGESNTAEEAEALIKKSLEAEKVKETLKSYDESIKSFIAKSLEATSGKVEELEKSIKDIQEENAELKKQLNEIQGKENAPEGDHFEGRKAQDDEDEDGILDLVKFHEKTFK